MTPLNPALIGEQDKQLFMRFRALYRVASTAQQLQVAYMIRAPMRFGYDMVYCEVAHLKMKFASVAVSALLAVKVPFVSNAVVLDDSAEVGAPGNVGAMNRKLIASEIPKFIFQTHHHQIFGLRRYVYPNPLTFRLLRCNAGCSATAEGVKHDIINFTAGTDNALDQGHWLLCRVVSAFPPLCLAYVIPQIVSNPPPPPVELFFATCHS